MRLHVHRSCLVRQYTLPLVLAVLSLVHVPLATAGIFRNAAVGGVSIDAQGVLRQPSATERHDLREAVEAQLVAVPAEMDTGLTLRRISLRKLEEALRQSTQRDLSDLPDEIRYLAGLQRVQYVLVYPEQQDVVLVGPAEGWLVSDAGHAVGKTTGRPVIQIEDLLVALQTAGASDEPISCSINPTQEGTRAMRSFLKKQKRFTPDVLTGIQQSLGPQQITIAGVPENSHFSRVLVAADFRMKRIAMRIEDSPIDELPSFLEMLAESRAKLTSMMPRWWLACDYEPLARSEDRLAWELRGNGVQVMTEDDLVADDGTVTATGTKSPVATQWAEKMTRQYDALSREEAVFGQLRNLMDLSVIAALIKREQLLDRAGCAVPILMGKDHHLILPTWNSPKTVASECTFIKRGSDYLITASGGVQIDSAYYAARSQVTRHVAQVHSKTAHRADRWWW